MPDLVTRICNEMLVTANGLRKRLNMPTFELEPTEQGNETPAPLAARPMRGRDIREFQARTRAEHRERSRRILVESQSRNQRGGVTAGVVTERGPGWVVRRKPPKPERRAKPPRPRRTPWWGRRRRARELARTEALAAVGRAYAEGLAAAKRGTSIAACPYQSGQQESAWLRGWARLPPGG